MHAKVFLGIAVLVGGGVAGGYLLTRYLDARAKERAAATPTATQGAGNG